MLKAFRQMFDFRSKRLAALRHPLSPKYNEDGVMKGFGVWEHRSPPPGPWMHGPCKCGCGATQMRVGPMPQVAQ